MQQPPFRLLAAADAALTRVDRADSPLRHAAVDCCATPEPEAREAVVAGRARLADLDHHLHCSVIGTCLSTAELRKLMARFADVKGASDLDIHHDAVRQTSHEPQVAKALQKALDHRHAPALQRASKLADAETLAAYWDESLHQGEVPGAYWAVLTHRKTTPALRQRVFGDVHMLSHLVGSANRADIRRLVALERDNAELREKLDRQQLRSQELMEERDRQIAALRRELIEATAAAAPERQDRVEETDRAGKAAALIALQTARRERAEQIAAAAQAEAAQLAETLEHLRRHTQALGRELGAAELQLRLNADDGGRNDQSAQLDAQLQGRRILYVGGRPSTYPAIRDLVLRHGGEFRRHGGGLEDRAGLLAAAVSWAHVVVFPVDCIDHESVDNLKRLCTRQQVRYLPLRSAGIGCFAAAFSGPAEGTQAQGEGREDGPAGTSPLCPRHG
ncbi:DUF2325 domain-containing protein [Variovorax sp. DAIF25]|uniref:DUF2325 domain-containing protein n=1 Tax=Variovorax sp. DAIF25 TaxID=3080983 RepID=UPI003D6C32D9